MEFLKVFDAYSLRARLFPAIIASAPAMAALALLVTWKSFGLSNAVASLGLLVLMFAIADFARERGRNIEKRLFVKMGGVPSVVLFRHKDSKIDPGTKHRYRAFLEVKLGSKSPSAEEEIANPEAADAFYDQCGVWLRQNTRDVKKFPLLFGENVTYGFRRNLLGVKWVGLGLNGLVVAGCVLWLWRDSWAVDSDQGRRILIVLGVASMHALYMLIAVRESAAWDAAQAYGRQLILSCEAFLSGTEASPEKKVPPEKAVARKRTPKKASADSAGTD